MNDSAAGAMDKGVRRELSEMLSLSLCCWTEIAVHPVFTSEWEVVAIET